MKTWDEIKSEVVSRLTEYIRPLQGELFQETILSIQVDNAMSEIASRRNYPSSYTEEAISKDMRKYLTNIYNLALYDYSQIGQPFEDSHSENGTSRGYSAREKCFNGVNPFVRVF